MQTKKIIRNSKHEPGTAWYSGLWWQVVVPGLYFVWMYLYYPFRNIFWMDHDEGINLMKSQMMLRGYSLYSDIWSDQPPLFTYLLAAVFRVTKSSVNIGRVLVLLMACMLFFFTINILYRAWGRWPALAGIVLLVLLPRFTDLSVSVMVGLPSIALAMFSLAVLVYWHKSHNKLWLVVSAVALGASVLTKIFTGFLAPIFLLGILIDSYAQQPDLRKWRQILLPGFTWGMILTVVIVVPILLIVRPENIHQLLNDHLSGAQVAVFQDPLEYGLLSNLYDARMILVLAVLGLVDAIIQKRWLALYPAAWMSIAFVLLYNHTPVWSHQQLLITIPAVILAAGAAGGVVCRIEELLRRKIHLHALDAFRIASLVIFVLIIKIRVPLIAVALNPSPAFQTPPIRETSMEMTVLNKIKQYADDTNWLLTDLPIFAFYADLPIPPNLVVFSNKRVLTENLTEAEILSTLIKLKPEQVLFGRNEFPNIRQYLEEHYQLIYERESLYMYLINDIALVTGNR